MLAAERFARLLEAIRLAVTLCSSQVLLLLGARSLWRLAALPAVSSALCRIRAVVTRHVEKDRVTSIMLSVACM